MAILKIFKTQKLPPKTHNNKIFKKSYRHIWMPKNQKISEKTNNVKKHFPPCKTNFFFVNGKNAICFFWYSQDALYKKVSYTPSHTLT